MKRFLPFLIFLYACTAEKNVEPAKATTFVRYFNGGNNDTAEAIIQTPDNGFILLATTEIKSSDVASTRYKIKLIKTDAFGNQIWQKLYPEFSANPDQEKSFKGHAVINLPEGGYAIAGEDIQNGSPNLMIMTTDSEGNNPVSKSVTLASQVSGKALAVNNGGNFIVLGLGAVPGSTEFKNMVLCEFKKATLDLTWSSMYEAGQVDLASRLFLDPQSNAFWGGTIHRDNKTSAVRFVKVVTNEANRGGIDFDLPIGTPGLTETGNDLCKFGSGFAIVGSTNGKSTGSIGDSDILFKRLASDGTELSNVSFPLKDMEPTLDQEQDDVGNAISATRDGGFILLGTVDSQISFGRGDKDLYLIKIDAFGTRAWSRSYGSKFEDLGVNVIQSSDGGYVMLSTTNLSKVSTIMMIKVDGEGNIE